MRVAYRLQRTGFGAFVLINLFAAALLLSTCRTSSAQVYHVGILSALPPFAPMSDGFKQRMTELGYIEGQNIIYDLQTVIPGSPEEQRAAKQFVDEKVDLIFAFATEGALTAKAATQGTTIPVVFASANLEGVDLVQNIAHPGENVTGARFPGPELTVARAERLRAIAPRATRIGLFYNANYPANKSGLDALRPEAARLGITLVEVPVISVAELQAKLQERAASADIGIDAILITTDDLTQSPDGWSLLSTFATQHALPIAGSAAFEADSGAIFSYIPDNIETGRLAADSADTIFKGTPAGDIPVFTPESKLRINIRRVQELGLTVPDGLLRQAAEIIR